jgi:hypothetical protein
MASTDTILVPTNGSGGTEILLSDEDAEMLRAYKVFLKSYRLREALYCDSCWDGTKEDGCKAFVTSNEILIKCRCTTRVYQGMRY